MSRHKRAPRDRGARGDNKPRTPKATHASDSRDLHALVLDFFKRRPGAALRVKDLIVNLATNSREEREVRDAVSELHNMGRIQRVKGKRYRYVQEEEKHFQGRMELSESGHGFMRRSDEEDLFIPRSKRLGASHGDRVEAAITGQGRFGLPQARVVRVIEKDDTPIIGRFLRLAGRGGIVYPDNPRVPGPIEVPESQIRGAKENDRVQVDVRDSRDARKGRIVQVFGPAENVEARFKALIAEHKFREKFSEESRKQAERSQEEITDSEIAERLDLREETVFTIDPASAKDFDDALSLKRQKNGDYEVGVHIADVSWYIPEGSPLDDEARQRGTSVYSSHGTLPMLPERLSSELCSLREGEEKRTVSVFFTVKPDGSVQGGGRLARSVIRSRKRLTYAQAQQMLEETGERYGEDLPPLRKNSLKLLLHHLGRLTVAMRRERFRQGGLNLEVPEYEIELDAQGQPVDIYPKELTPANHLVEECMLAANRAVTEIANRQRGAGVHAFVYRIHARPDPEKLQDFAAFLEALDIEFPFSDAALDSISSRQLDEYLRSLEDHPLIGVIRVHCLRAMSKAEYSTENIGHYGLGFPNYTHFTSPIRRYPDLVVHRLLLRMQEGRARHGKDVQSQLQRTCDLASERERAAQDFERQSLKIRQAEYFRRKIGEVFNGMIVGSVPKGVFVEIDGTGAQGMIQAEDLGSVFFDRSLQAFVAIGGEELFGPGKRLPVRVIDADPDLGRLELEPA